MRIHYIFSKHNSHSRVARAYCQLIGQWHSFAPSADTADVIILHCEPHDYVSIYRSCQLANKYVVAFAVWEADELPEAYKRSLEFVQEVWVPSQYCRAAFENYHPRVYVVPHVLHRDGAVSDIDRAAVKHMVRYDERHIHYLTITKVWDRRKNVQMVIDAFERLRAEMPDARLLVKACYPDLQPRISDARITVINANLTDAQIGALYECADVYVSAHHSEGWGLTMADALLLQKPTIGTGYSGNLEFMNEDNSFLLAFEEENIHEEDVFGLFTARMKWAYPSQKDLEDKLLMLYRMREDRAVQDAIQYKLKVADIQRFGPREVGAILQSRLKETERHVFSRRKELGLL